MGKLFGTDGVRGIPGEFPLTRDFVRGLGFTAASLFLERASGLNGGRPAIVLGRDTRGSGADLARSLTEGFSQAGCLTLDLGVATTPAVACLTPRLGALFGAVISASHNPPEFNGIKFFTGQGFKAPEELEDRIESRLAYDRETGCRRLESVRAAARPAAVLRRASAGLVAGYRDYLRSTLPADCDFSGLRLVLDAANGAAYEVAPALLRSLGATVFPLGDSPDGSNINTGCGALDTRRMRREVVRRRADCGVSLDGDADRAIFCDERGRLIDGDALIAMSALHLKEQGLLRGDKVVVTVMSNLGMIRYLQEQGIGTVQVPVGDRNVTDALEREGLSLGGENSGHIVFRRLAPTGDGLLTCLQTLALLKRSGRAMSHFRSLYRSYPQLLRNVRVERRVPLEELPLLGKCIAESRIRLKGAGRVFVRYSGTEPLLRILVEGPDAKRVRDISERLAVTFKREVQAKADK